MMTREEAIKYFELLLKRFEEMYETETSYWGKVHTETTIEATRAALSALRPVSREQVERMRGEWRSIHGLSEYYCSRCGEEFEIHAYDKDKFQFCPYCMAPMTDEAVEIRLKELGALQDGQGD